MSEPIDELYFKFLYSLVGDLEAKNPARTHWRLTKKLFTKEFFWIVPNDDNRIADGVDLRDEFVASISPMTVPPSWFMEGCSVFEVMIGLARRLSFETDREPSYWFWHLIHNLGLYHFTDLVELDGAYANDVIDAVIWRTYRDDGHGGFFPLRYPKEDQRKVELWYQMNSYVLETERKEG